MLVAGMDGRPRWGAEARGGWARGVLALGATTAAEPGLRERLAWIAAGGSWILARQGGFRGRIEVLVERQEVELTGEPHDVRSRWVPGVRGVVDASWSPGKGLLLGGSLGLGLRAGSTEVFRSGQRIGTLHRFRPEAGGWLGIEF
jgi:hypothetical protein